MRLKALILPLLLAAGVALASQIDVLKAKLFAAVPAELRAQVEQIAGKELFQQATSATGDLRAQADALVAAAAPSPATPRAPGVLPR